MTKPNIVFTRIDNRLVHGQVGNVWIPASGANLIVVVDDEVAQDSLQQQLMEMTADTANVDIRFYSIQKAIETIPKASEKQRLFIVAREPSTILKLINHNIPIKECNIGNMHHSEGKKVSKSPHVYLDDQDKKDLQTIRDNGVNVYIQITPDNRKLNFE